MFLFTLEIAGTLRASATADAGAASSASQPSQSSASEAAPTDAAFNL